MTVLQSLTTDASAYALDAAAAARTALLRGQEFGCPVCGSSFRRFTQGGRHFAAKQDGYCPRCNSKPRHRWLWMHLPESLAEPRRRNTSVLHIGPSHSTYRAFNRWHLGRYVTTGIGQSPRYDHQLDLTNLVLSEQFDVVICVHVLEHIEDDRAAIAGLARLVKPDGEVLVGIPIRSGETLEDPTVTDPDERNRLFGEPDHWRWYGMDVVDRLEGGGFDVQSYLTTDSEPSVKQRFGLKPGEGLFRCKTR